MKKTLIIAMFAGAASLAHAQFTPPAAGAASAPAAAPAAAPSAAKAALLQRLANLQQERLEFAARNMGELPLRQLIPAAEQHLENMAADKRDAAKRQIEGLVRKYAEDLPPVAKDAVAKTLPALVPVFDKNFTEDELRQLVTALESPVFKKYNTSLAEVTSVANEKLFNEMRVTLDPRVTALQQNIGAALGLQPGAAPAPSGKPAAGKKPAPKK